MRSLIGSLFMSAALLSGGASVAHAGNDRTTVTVTSPDGRIAVNDTFVQDNGAIVVTFHCDVDFTPRERLVIADVSDTWFIQTGGMVIFKRVYDLDFRNTAGLAMHKAAGHSILIRRDSDNPFKDEDGVLGTTMPSGGIHLTGQVIVQAMMHHIPTERVLWSTLLHEFGHVVGMQHTEDPYAVLHPSINKRNVGRCLTRPDIAELCRVNDCTGWHMRYCR